MWWNLALCPRRTREGPCQGDRPGPGLQGQGGSGRTWIWSYLRFAKGRSYPTHPPPTPGPVGLPGPAPLGMGSSGPQREQWLGVPVYPTLVPTRYTPPWYTPDPYPPLTVTTNPLYTAARDHGDMYI